MVFALASHASAQGLRILIDDPPGPKKFKVIRADELANLMADSSSHVKVYDANLPDTRVRVGVIDGAHLLSSYDNYNIAKELPADKNAKLVFYCFDKRCMASDAAADRACDAGYKNVSVMGDGILGWRPDGCADSSSDRGRSGKHRIGLRVAGLPLTFFLRTGEGRFRHLLKAFVPDRDEKPFRFRGHDSIGGYRAMGEDLAALGFSYPRLEH